MFLAIEPSLQSVFRILIGIILYKQEKVPTCMEKKMLESVVVTTLIKSVLSAFVRSCKQMTHT